VQNYTKNPIFSTLWRKKYLLWAIFQKKAVILHLENNKKGKFENKL